MPVGRETKRYDVIIWWAAARAGLCAAHVCRPAAMLATLLIEARESPGEELLQHRV